MDELNLTRTLERGHRGKEVRGVQEWLSFRGIGVVADGDYGPATEFAVCEFQRSTGLAETGAVDQTVFEALTAPLREVLENGSPRGELPSRIAYYARRHLGRHPREVGGQNRGPWVRLYMEGQEGEAWPWCAGFACLVLRQACESLEMALPIQPSVSCDSLAHSAKERGRFLHGTPSNRSAIRPGDFFLARRTATDWTHVGIVIKVSEEVFRSVEGNTNDDGDREGYEVCSRVRGFEGKDFIRMGTLGPE